MKSIPNKTKIYKTLYKCCKYQNRLPTGCQPIFDRYTGKALGFAALPAGEYWVK